MPNGKHSSASGCLAAAGHGGIDDFSPLQLAKSCMARATVEAFTAEENLSRNEFHATGFKAAS